MNNVNLPKAQTIDLPRGCLDLLASFDSSNQREKERKIEAAVHQVNEDLKRQFCLFINRTEYSRFAHNTSSQGWKKIAMKVAAVLLCMTLIFAYFGLRLWKASNQFQQAELAKQKLEFLGLSQRDIYVLLDHSHQAFYIPLQTAFSPDQYGCTTLPTPPQKISPRIWSEGISGQFSLTVYADKTAMLSSTSYVEIALGITPQLRGNPDEPTTTLQTNHVQLTLAIPEMKLILSQA